MEGFGMEQFKEIVDELFSKATSYSFCEQESRLSLETRSCRGSTGYTRFISERKSCPTHRLT